MSLPIIILLCCIDTVVHEKSSYLIPFCMRTGSMCVRMLDVNLRGALLRGVIVFANFAFPSGPLPSGGR